MASPRCPAYHIATNTAYDYLRRRRHVAYSPLTDEHVADDRIEADVLSDTSRMAWNRRTRSRLFNQSNRI
jgi:DNA-directed RNA polymerase specialized sigma24 family protein